MVERLALDQLMVVRPHLSDPNQTKLRSFVMEYLEAAMLYLIGAAVYDFNLKENSLRWKGFFVIVWPFIAALSIVIGFLALLGVKFKKFL